MPIALAFAFIADLNQAITFSILSGVLHYTFMSINMVMFRNKWPVGVIRRGYTHPFHPLPAALLFMLCVITIFAIFLGFGSQLSAMVIFYIIVSLWFNFYRYKYSAAAISSRCRGRSRAATSPHSRRATRPRGRVAVLRNAGGPHAPRNRGRRGAGGIPRAPRAARA
jgi:amino acid transporter